MNDHDLGQRDQYFSGSASGEDREDSQTLFIPPELYERMLTLDGTLGAPAYAADQEQEEPEMVASERELEPVPPSGTTTLARPGQPPHRAGEESTLCSARSEDLVRTLRSEREPQVVLAVMPHAALPVSANGTLVMAAMPYLVDAPPPPAPPPPAPPSVRPHDLVAGPDSARVRQALDEMSMVIDIHAMQKKVAVSSDDELSRYVERLRRAEGIPEVPVAAPMPYAPEPAYAQASMAPYAYPTQRSAQPPAWHPQPYAPAAFSSQPPPPMAIPERPRPSVPPSKAAKKSSGFAAVGIFALMFIATLAGVGAVTYVALRSGKMAASDNAVTTLASR